MRPVRRLLVALLLGIALAFPVFGLDTFISYTKSTASKTRVLGIGASGARKAPRANPSARAQNSPVGMEGHLC